MHPQPSSNPLNECQNDYQIALFNLEEPFGDEVTRKSEDSSTIARIFLAIDAYEPFHNIQNFSRMGNYKPYGKPRHIVISFSSETHQQKVLQNAHRLNDIRVWKRISITLYRFSKEDTAVETHNNVEQENAAELKQELEKIKQQMAACLKLQQSQPQSSEHKNVYEAPHQIITENNTIPIQAYKAPPSPPPKPKPTPQLFFAQHSMNDVNHSSTNGQLYPDLSKISEVAIMQQHQNMEPDVTEIELNQQNIENNSKIIVKPIQVVSPAIIKNPYSDDREDLKKEQTQKQYTKQKTYQNQLYHSQNLMHAGTKQTLNILVLGETGVGKSTWINGIANYMTFNTLQDAIGASQPICLIPSHQPVHKKSCHQQQQRTRTFFFEGRRCNG